ncbi:ferrochelatase [Cronobacter dublinensis]|uniref:Ferrochelatase n=2 Tax=Cronobacter dublinensis TaxID=413497 RepID=A0ABM9Q3X1_9ENTR|nr:ferrochelatase [Cronobacter dublinensis]EGT5713057.1 ferrochelatase [Cronobacter dublinensis subsp. dublinensis]CCJ80116.1 Ferrochelatase, protoheme ferro-lyase [Cronobacter dublinensis 1210]ALB65940.1 ferrochelatase [Cronobacter dublinensis subsp. dublinensis LMG 23823]EGT5736815.1 ferrochelatase [Cronobacter dublinensis subsp. dublinensis]EKM6455626.1 ferrochelatase [Cronobacter dublinensis]
MQSVKSGVLLVNLGTPQAPTPSAVKRYLKQFLSDRRVVDVPRVIWWPLLRGVILPLRSPRVAKLYQSIWMEEGSPLMVYSRRQEKALSAALGDVPVALGMSYGQPSLDSAVQKLLDQHVDHIIVLALYPQYSCSTVAAVWDELARITARYRKLPSMTLIRDYACEPTYISALVQSVQRSFEKHGEPDLLLLSYHGIPQRYADEGDDYPQRCRDTTRELVSALGIAPEKIMMTFQSRFGREPWLTPYTDETMKMLGEKGVKHIQVMCPGFSSDCLETLEEIAEQNREIFIEAGGEKYEYIPALNDEPAHIAMMKELVDRYR